MARSDPPAFKTLSCENWQEPDPTSTTFWRLSQVVDRPLDMGGNDWAREFLAVEVKDHVPPSVRDLFAVARGALLYGWFFYPLFRLGEEQLYRVVEAAVIACYRDLDGRKSDPTFEHAVGWLIEQGIIPADDQERWTATRTLRNRASHLEDQAVMPPGTVLAMLKATAHDINRLFARSTRASLARG